MENGFVIEEQRMFFIVIKGRTKQYNSRIMKSRGLIKENEGGRGRG